MLHAMGLDDADSFSLPATTTSASSPSTSSPESSPLDRRKAYHRPDPLQAKLQGLQERVTSLSRQLGGLLPDPDPYDSSTAPPQLAQRPSTMGAAAVATALSIGAAASAAIGSHVAGPDWRRGHPTPGHPTAATSSNTGYHYPPPNQAQGLPGHDHLGRQAGGGLGAPRHPSVAFDMRRHDVSHSPAGQQRPAGGGSGSSVQGGTGGAWSETYTGTHHDVLHSTYVVRNSSPHHARGSMQHAAAAGSPGRGFGAAALGSLGLALAGPREHASPSHHHGTAAGLATGRTGASSGHLWRDFTQTGTVREAFAPDSAQQREEERLKAWVQQLRHERRRLEDRLLMGDPQGMRLLDMRDEAEHQVMGLSRERDALAQEVGSLVDMQQLTAQLQAQVADMKQQLQLESQARAEAQDALGRLQELHAGAAQQLDTLQQQHLKAVEEFDGERRTLTTKYKKAVRKAMQHDQARATAAAELQHTRFQLQASESARAELQAVSDAAQAANTQLQDQVACAGHEAKSLVRELRGLLEQARQEAESAKRQLADATQGKEAAETKAKDMTLRCDFLRAERERTVTVLQAEQQQSTAQQSHIEHLQSQVQALERQNADVINNARVQLVSLQQQYEGAAVS